MENPTVFASQHTGGVWGFAIPNTQIHGLDLGFDTSYSSTTAATARFAAVPTTPTPFSQTSAPNTTPDTYHIFFAVATGTETPAGTYSGVVTISGALNLAEIPDCARIASGFITGCTDNLVEVVLPSGMVGVRYTGTPDAPQWTISGPSDPLWYDYAFKQWANAVTFQTSTNRNLPVGTVLNQSQLDDILGYWVYIPRFEYRLINTGFDGTSHCSPVNPQFCPRTFDVRFVHRNAPIQSGIRVGSWHTHPGFQLNDQQVSGLWMAKYEASLNKGDGTNCIAVGMTGCNITLDSNGNRASTFMPLASTWTNINLLNIHRNAQNIPEMHGITYSNQNNFIVNGLTNASWGAAAYLSQSLYGVCTNRYCSSNGIRLTVSDGPNLQKIHNNGYFQGVTDENDTGIPRFLTGCGPSGTVQNPNDLPYNTANCAGREWHTEIGMLASSTHNATGIFDLAGGVTEHTFSARANPTDTTTFTNWQGSGLNAGNFNFHRFSDLLYFNDDFLRCLASCPEEHSIVSGSFLGLPRYFGLALAETTAKNTNLLSTNGPGGWGNDGSHSPGATNPWFSRGGTSGYRGSAGVFYTWGVAGGPAISIGWRAVIAGN